MSDMSNVNNDPAPSTEADRNFDPTPQPDPTPAAADTPTAPAAASAPSSPPPETPAPAPWTESLAEYFEDETQREVADRWAREKVQPYVTQREQQLGEVGKVWEGLWDQEKSIGTYLALTEQMYGPEAAQAVAEGLQAQLEASQAAETDLGQTSPEDGGLDEWLEQQPAPVRDYLREQFESKEDDQFDNDMLEWAQKHEDPSILVQDGTLFANFLATADTWEQAYAAWQSSGIPQAIASNPTAFGVESQGEPPPEAMGDPEPAPTVLGTGAATSGGEVGAAVPSESQTLDEAVNLFFQDISGTPADTSRGF